MELKQSSNSIIENVNATASISPVFDNLLWTTLQQSTKSTNIVKTINHLVNMYHPNDGIVAYERLIKTLLSLSENLDSEMQQQIISIVPFPNGIPNEKIRNVIYKTAEIVKATNNISTSQKITLGPESKLNVKMLNENAEIHLNQNMLMDRTKEFELNETFVPSASELFKGFPPNEISTIHSHVRNVNDMYNTFNYSVPYVKPYLNVQQHFLTNANVQGESFKFETKSKEVHAPYLYRRNSCGCSQDLLKSIDDKFNQPFIDKDKEYCANNSMGNQRNKNHVINLEITYSDVTSLKTDIGNGILSNSDVSERIKKRSNLCKRKNFNIEVPKYLGQDLRYDHQAIQQDIYKMDVVRCDDDRSNILEEDHYILDDFVIQENLKKSLERFLKRGEQNVLNEFSASPESKSSNADPFALKSWEFKQQKFLENYNLLGVSDHSVDNSKCTGVTENVKKCIEKKAIGLNPNSPKPSQLLHLLHRNVNTTVSKTEKIEYERGSNIGNLLYKSAVKQSKQKGFNILQKAPSITELTTFKKQYYDTLLNIQKAKIAVANSLAISSVENYSKFDQHCTSHLYQEQQSLHQHEPLTANPQCAVHTVTQAELTNINATPYTWMQCNNWKHPTTKQLKLPQQLSFNVSRNKE